MRSKSATSRTILQFVWVLGITAALAACFGSSRKASDTETARRKAMSLLAETRFQPPAGWRWGTFRNADGARLRYGWAEPGGKHEGSIVFLPGYQTTAEAAYETVRDLTDAGYAVWVLDRRGQGGSDRWLDNRQKYYSIGFEHDAHDVEEFVRDIVHPEAGKPRFLVGESLGGHIGFRVLHDQPDLFQAAAFSSPSIAFHTGGFPVWLVRIVTGASTALGLGRAYAIGEHDWRFDPDAGDARDPAKNDRERALMAQAWYLKNPDLISGGATNTYVTELFNSSALEQSPGWLEAIRTPLLLGQVAGDQIADAAVMAQACSRLVRCRLMSFTGTRHALFSDTEATRAAWMSALIRYLESWSPSGPPPP